MRFLYGGVKVSTGLFGGTVSVPRFRGRVKNPGVNINANRNTNLVAA